MTWPEIIDDLKLIWSWLCWIASGAEWIVVRVVFVICAIALPVFVVAFVVGVWYLKWKSENPSS